MSTFSYMSKLVSNFALDINFPDFVPMGNKPEGLDFGEAARRLANAKQTNGGWNIDLPSYIHSNKDSIQSGLEPWLKGFPGSEAAGIVRQNAEGDNRLYVSLPKSKDEISTEFPLTDVIESSLSNGKQDTLTLGHTHPTELRGNAVYNTYLNKANRYREASNDISNNFLKESLNKAADNLEKVGIPYKGKFIDINNMPKYPSGQDYLSNNYLRNYKDLNFPGYTGQNVDGDVLSPNNYVVTEEYGKPVQYEYTSHNLPFNPIRRINRIQDAIRMQIQDNDIMKGLANNNPDLVKQAFLRRASEQEYLTHQKNPYLEVTRYGEPIPDELPTYAPSRAGEVTVGGATALAGIKANQAIQNRLKQQKAKAYMDTLQKTNEVPIS